MTDVRVRIPLITASAEKFLQRLQEHPHAPRYTHLGFNRVSPGGLRRIREFEEQIQAEPPQGRPGQRLAWLAGFVADLYRDVPFYHRAGPPPADFFDLPTTDRADLNREPWAFVPEAQPLENLVVYNTAGTTGHPLEILTHPDILAHYTPLLRAALARYGVTLAGGPERVTIALVCWQQHTYTYAAIAPELDQAAFVKVNLNPAEWRDPADRARFLDDLAPEILTGDPLAFAELARLPLRTRPKALVSTAMTLTAGTKAALEARFECPLVDLYSLNESGPVAVADRDGAVWHLLQPRLFVEVLDPAGQPCPAGIRGEITLTGGFNPFLPLLRYRTGDFASLDWRGIMPVLVGLEGRPPVTFCAADGLPLNNIDISLALRPFAIAQYTLHQNADGSLVLGLLGAGEAGQIRAALLALFGSTQRLTIRPLAEQADKVVQYTSDLEFPA